MLTISDLMKGRTNERTGQRDQPKNIMLSPTLSASERIKIKIGESTVNRPTPTLRFV